MNDLDKRSEFDDEWQNAFADAEVEPSDDVWVKVDAFLANDEARRYRNKAFYYKLVAAASIVVAIGFGLLSLFGGNESMKAISTSDASGQTEQNEQIEQNEQTELLTERKKQKERRETLAKSEPAKDVDESIGNDRIEASEDAIHSAQSSQSGRVNNEPSAMASANEGANTKANEGIPAYESATGEESQAIASHQGFLPGSEEEKAPENDLPVREELAGQGDGLLAFAEKRNVAELDNQLLSPQMEINKVTDISDFIKEEPVATETFWAGLAVGTGMFDPDYKAGSGISNQGEFLAFTPEGYGTTRWNSAVYDYSSDDGVPKQNAVNPGMAYTQKAVPRVVDNKSQPGLSYSMGLNFGVRVAKKWVIQSGVYYAKQVTSSSTGTVSVDAENSNIAYPIHISNLTAARENFSNILYQVNVDIYNNFEFLSLPLKAGYLVLDNKHLDLLMSAGVTSDFFINNEIKDEGLGLQEVNVKPGSESPYRNVLFNGVVSAELKYDLSDGRYSLYVEPSYRMSLNSFTKSDYMFSSRPRSFNVGVGVKYNFN